MKSLFRSRFPFVEYPNEQLTDEQLAIKKMYNEIGSDAPCAPCEEEKANRLRNVPTDEQVSAGGAGDRQVKSRRTR